MAYMIMNILVLLGKLEATYDYSSFYNNNNKTHKYATFFQVSELVGFYLTKRTWAFFAQRMLSNYQCQD